MQIIMAQTEQQIANCFPVMAQLRPHLTPDTFVAQVQRQSRDGGYRLVYLEAGGAIKACAGFRIVEMLAHGRFLYVDDLVTHASERSHGYGGQLIDWLEAYARAHNCTSLQLDSGVQRTSAHRFYFSKRLVISAYHFARTLE